MISIEKAKEIARSFPGAEEQVHWDRPAFRVKKKIFATMWPLEKRMVLKLTVVEQSVFTDMDKTIFSPVNGTWGKQGYTNVDLAKVKKAIFVEAIRMAWTGVAPKGHIGNAAGKE
jgi:predicted DNA-binding protein (MmcQ/YjbR family)